MFAIQKHLFLLLVFTHTPSVPLKGLQVYFPDEGELGFGQDQFILFISVIMHYE